MGGICKTVVVFSLLASPILFYLFINDRLFPVDKPALPEKKWFGPGNRPAKEDKSVKPFKVNVDSKILEGLKKRIALDMERLTEPLEDVAFNYGFNTKALQPLLQYWKDDYDWRATETELNKFPHFKVGPLF